MATPNPFLNHYRTLRALQNQFLETKGWVETASSCRALYNLCREALKASREAAPLMDHVLNINKESKKKILEIIKTNPELILVKTKGDVKYFSSKQKKMVVRIGISNLSPLEAAALSGDFHLVNIFKHALPDDKKHQAGLQLEAILSGPNFLCAFKVLQEAYQKYLTEYDALCQASNWKGLDELWEQVGESQKRLSTFGLQVFCNPIPHRPLPDFTQEPIRACNFEVYSDNGLKIVESDFDMFGFGSMSGLLKGGHADPRAALCAGGYVGHGALVDFEAINLLCKVIPEQLGISKTLLLQYAPDSNKKSERAPSPSTASLASDKVLENLPEFKNMQEEHEVKEMREAQPYTVDTLIPSGAYDEYFMMKLAIQKSKQESEFKFASPAPNVSFSSSNGVVYAESCSSTNPLTRNPTAQELTPTELSPEERRRTVRKSWAAFPLKK